MYNLPDYFNHFPAIFTPEIIEVLVSVEKSFNIINYENHFDDIDFLLLNPGFNNSKDINNLIMSVYRDHINSVLSILGILLSNPYTDSISVISTILRTICILGTNSLSDILDDSIIDEENSGDTFFATIIANITHLNVIQVLHHIALVSPDVLDYLHHDNPIPIFNHDLSKFSENRFKRSSVEKKGIIVDAIRNLNRFGYSVHTFLLTHSHAISETHDTPELIAHEIILLVLGSSTPDNLLLATMLEVSEHVVDNAILKIQVNGIITKYIKDSHE